MKTKPIPSSGSAWGSGTAAPPDPRICQHGAGAPGVDLGTGRHAKAGETGIPGDIAGRDKEISLLYRLRQPDCRRAKLVPPLWYTVTFCGKINGDGVERMHLQEIVNRIDQRLESLGISALEAERRAGRRDAIRNMRRAVARGKGGVTMRTIDALAPALSTTPEWLLTGQDRIEADENTEIILVDKRSPLDDDRVIEAFGLAFQSLVGKLITEVEAYILARSVVRIIRLPEAAMTQAERRDMIWASVRLFRH